MALSLNGKKRHLKKRDFLEYFAMERLELNQKVIAEVLQEILKAIPRWQELIGHSFLSQGMQEKYLHLLKERYQQLGAVDI